MHMAMTAAVNNDVLAELLLTASMLALVHHLRAPEPRDLRAVGVGFLVGLGLATKVTVFVALPLAVVGVLAVPRGCAKPHGGGLRRPELRRRARDAVLIIGVAGLVLLPWLVRNRVVYGDLDLLGLRRHDLVVVGQPRTAEWLAERGYLGLFRSFVCTTFRSFWGQFGWMGVVLDSRLYLLLGILSGLAALGAGLKMAARAQAAWPRVLAETALRPKGWLLLLLGLWLASAVGSYLWYNLQFVQHQGRYLFSAIVPLGVLFAIGLDEVLSLSRAWLVASVCVAGGALLILAGLAMSGPNTWAVMLLAGTGMGFVLRRRLPRSWDAALRALPYAGLFVLDWICLFGFVVPWLS
jgi:hypothetical protein